ncbi:PTS transporter subunit EIIB [Merdibacter massiliensis]|uniref:PTS transporter subunit EIIB n=1 Tax=Merdibacter massiliensis TaxID=1871030 RepID=UPI00096A5DF4|nr:PTS transporter subunit EIIB [Merdibacter massiliensis]
MAKKDYANIAKSIVEVSGGATNILNVSHCMTRLRLQLSDGSKLDMEKAKTIPGVINVIVQNGEYQFVIGQDVPSAYEEIIKIEGIKAGGSVEDAEALKQDSKMKGNVENVEKDV